MLQLIGSTKVPRHTRVFQLNLLR